MFVLSSPSIFFFYSLLSFPLKNLSSELSFFLLSLLFSLLSSLSSSTLFFSSLLYFSTSLLLSPLLSSKDDSSKGDFTKIPLKQSEEELKEELEKAKIEATRMKNEAKTEEEKIAATKADVELSKKKKDFTVSKQNQMHLWEKVPNATSVANRLKNWNDKIQKAEHDFTSKNANKEVSLGTSKINYMDPRITVAFCKRNEIHIEKPFSRTLRDKFNWAMSVTPEWEFCGDVGEEE